MEPETSHRVTIARRSVSIVFALILSLLCVPAQSLAQETGPAIKWSGNGLRLELAPLPFDNVRAFFIGRGFSSKDADFIAQTGCVFRSAIGNAGSATSDPAITIKLKKWQIIHRETSDESAKSLMTREDWAKVWNERKIAETPKVAFHWALFPTEQQYNPTDYNWGMITLGLPPGTKFDLQVVWSKAGVEQRHLMKNLECGK